MNERTRAALDMVRRSSPLEKTTGGQAFLVNRCRYCGADDYVGVLNHKPLCIWVAASLEPEIDE